MAVEVRAEMVATIWKAEVSDGAEVSVGDVLVILESMKMEIPVEAPVAGRCALKVKEGDTIQEGDVIALVHEV